MGPLTMISVMLKSCTHKLRRRRGWEFVAPRRCSGVDGGGSEEGEESGHSHQSVEQAQPHQQHHHLEAAFLNTILSIEAILQRAP